MGVDVYESDCLSTRYCYTVKSLWQSVAFNEEALLIWESAACNTQPAVALCSSCVVLLQTNNAAINIGGKRLLGEWAAAVAGLWFPSAVAEQGVPLYTREGWQASVFDIQRPQLRCSPAFLAASSIPSALAAQSGADSLLCLTAAAAGLDSAFDPTAINAAITQAAQANGNRAVNNAAVSWPAKSLLLTTVIWEMA